MIRVWIAGAWRSARLERVTRTPVAGGGVLVQLRDLEGRLLLVPCARVDWCDPSRPRHVWP